MIGYRWLKSISNGKTNLTKTIPPDTSILNQSYEDGFQISWTKCTDNDFQSYRLQLIMKI